MMLTQLHTTPGLCQHVSAELHPSQLFQACQLRKDHQEFINMLNTNLSND